MWKGREKVEREHSRQRKKPKQWHRTRESINLLEGTWNSRWGGGHWPPKAGDPDRSKIIKAEHATIGCLGFMLKSRVCHGSSLSGGGRDWWQ